MKHTPRKRFGQNFLKDDAVLHRIVDIICPQPKDTMVEIGPGLAAMTRLLAPHVGKLHVVEIDRDLCAYLNKNVKINVDATRLTVHEADALSFDFAALAVPPARKLRIVGNLPYNISSPLLFHLAGMAQHVEDQHFMLQKEVVQRMVAEPGSKAFGRLSVMLQWRYHMECMLIVPPHAFEPQPQVESAIVRMIPLAQPLHCDGKQLEKIVQQAFSQRRKVIRNALSGMVGEQQFSAANIDPQLRPEAVSVEQYVTLTNLLT